MLHHEEEPPDERVEEAARSTPWGRREGDRLTRDAAVAVTLMAIVASALGLLQEEFASEALGLQLEAVLAQDRSTDQWGLFQAKSVKKNLYRLAARAESAAGRDPSSISGAAELFVREEAEARDEAERLGAEARDLWERSRGYSRRQHLLALAETLAHVGIAVSSLAVLARRRAALRGAAALAVLGLGVALVTLAV